VKKEWAKVLTFVCQNLIESMSGSFVEGKGWLFQVLKLQFLTSQKIHYKTVAISLLQCYKSKNGKYVMNKVPSERSECRMRVISYNIFINFNLFLI
jgi:hypothetical protein